VSLCSHVDIPLFGDVKCPSSTIKHYTESFLRTAFSQVNVRPRLRSSIGFPVRTCIWQRFTQKPAQGTGLVGRIDWPQRCSTGHAFLMSDSGVLCLPAHPH
jgi:hypothetical protein